MFGWIMKCMYTVCIVYRHAKHAKSRDSGGMTPKITPYEIESESILMIYNPLAIPCII